MRDKVIFKHLWFPFVRAKNEIVFDRGLFV